MRGIKKDGFWVLGAATIAFIASLASIADSRTIRDLFGIAGDPESSSLVAPMRSTSIATGKEKLAPPASPQVENNRPSPPLSSAVTQASPVVALTPTPLTSSTIAPVENRSTHILKRPTTAPIGIAAIICAAKSIQTEVEVSDYSVSAMRQFNGVREVELDDCNPDTGTFAVKGPSGLDRSPTRGSAKAYSLTFEVIIGSRNGNTNTDTLCRIGANDITERSFMGTMSCQYRHYQGTYPIRITI